MHISGPPPADSTPRTPGEPPQPVRRNPLVRRSDRTETLAGRLLLALWLFAIPICAVAGFLWWGSVSATAIEQQHTRSQTVAVTTERAPSFAITDRGVALTDQVPTQARWMTGSGATRTGAILIKGNAPAGTEQRIWVEQNGDITDPPMSSAVAASLVLLGVVGAWVCWGGLLLGGRQVVRHRLNRRRYADWGHEWLLVEPLWSGR